MKQRKGTVWNGGRHRTDRTGETNPARGLNGSVLLPELGLWPAWDDVDPRWEEERLYDEADGPRDPHARPLRINGTKVG